MPASVNLPLEKIKKICREMFVEMFFIFLQLKIAHFPNIGNVLYNFKNVSFLNSGVARLETPLNMVQIKFNTPRSDPTTF